MEELLNKSLICIGNADLEAAFKLLEERFQKDHTFIVLKARYSNYLKEKMKGLNRSEDLHFNEIASALVIFIKSNLKRELFSAIWIAREEKNKYVSEQIKETTEKSLIVHDSFFSREIDHKWEKAIDFCLKNGKDVTLFLARPGSAPYLERKETLHVKNPTKEFPESITNKLKRYPETFHLQEVEKLYLGPFVLIDNQRLFLGLFLPFKHSEDLPILEFGGIDEESDILQSIQLWMDEAKGTT